MPSTSRARWFTSTSSTLRLGYNQLMYDKVVFVFGGDANAHHSEWLELVSTTYRHIRACMH